QVANAVREDAIEQRTPLFAAARTIRLDQLHHRVLDRVESGVVVAQAELRHLEGALLDTGQKMLESAAGHQLLVLTPLDPENGRVINAGERNKRGHERCNAPRGAALTARRGHCVSVNQEL